MPDLLLISKDIKSYFALEELGNSQGYRVKATTESAIAKDWLKLRSFDVAFVDAQIDISEQQELAGLLWKNNPGSPFVVFDLEREVTAVEGELRLYGADIAYGKSAIETLKRYLTESIALKDQDKGNFKILIVEDLDSPRDIICFYVESLGFGSVHGVASGKEAMKELEQNPKEYSCVITDIRMPEISGKDLIDFIRRHEKLRHLPVIALTAYGTVDMLVDCLKAGASGFLVKPPKKDDMTRELSRAVRIISRRRSPRLASDQEAELLRDLLVEKGFS